LEFTIKLEEGWLKSIPNVGIISAIHDVTIKREKITIKKMSTGLSLMGRFAGCKLLFSLFIFYK
jgi:hypothetical protein